VHALEGRHQIVVSVQRRADAMTVRLVFFGLGAQEVSPPEPGMMIDFAQNLYNEGTTRASDPPAVCPTPADGQHLLLQPDLGYCLLYPAAYSLVQTNPSGMEIVMDSVMNHIDPRLSISVEPANGRTLDEVAAEIEANFAPPGFNIERGMTTVDGVEAVLFDNLPGQDLNRRVAFIHNGRLYNLFLAPLGEEGTETRQQAAALYQLALDSFRFLNESAPTPTVRPIGAEAANATTATHAAIAAAMLDALAADGAPVAQMGIAVQAVADEHARVAIYPDAQQAPGNWFLGFAARVDGAWKSVVYGSGMEAHMIEALGVPRSVWPAVWLE